MRPHPLILPMTLITALLLQAAPAAQREGDPVCPTFQPIRPVPEQPIPVQRDPANGRSAGIQSADEVFDKIESACGNGDPNQFNPLLASKIYLNFFTGENGHFSANQAYFILRKFFAEHRAISCSLPTRSVHSPGPYATGQIQYLYRGTRYTAQIYTALTRADGGWLLTHLTISQRP